MSAEFFPNNDLRICEFQSHLMPPNLEFYPYLDISWRVDDDTPTIEVWGQSSVPAAENWDETVNPITEPWSQSTNPDIETWVESERPTITTWR